MCHYLSFFIPKIPLCNYLSKCLSNTTHLNSVALHTSTFHNKPVTLKADSGASNHFLTERDAPIFHKKKRVINGPPATLPNRQHIYPTIDGNLPLPSLSPNATSTYVYPQLTNSSLLSIGQLCDEGCVAIFTKYFLQNTIPQ